MTDREGESLGPGSDGETTASREFTLEQGRGGPPRTHTCGELDEKRIGEAALLMGWVDRVRDHGGILFIDLRDRYGVTQVVVPEERLIDEFRSLRGEDVIAVQGTVAARPESMVNEEMKTGRIEVAASEIKVLSPSAVTPFPLSEASEVSEELRLEYRYLDLRRSELQNNLRIRHDATLTARRYLSGRGFLEIETPMLVKSTPEGARDYVVPSRVHPGKFYALPQSPQIYKQILMVSGFDRYFQIARCLRDEDLRADRQPEHTQIDLEMSFVEEEDVFDVVEGLMVEVFKGAGYSSLRAPFPRITYEEAITRYGTDKPDLRFGLELVDVTEAWRSHVDFRVAEKILGDGGEFVGINLPNGGSRSRREIDELEARARTYGAAGLLWFRVNGHSLEGPTAKFLSPEGVESLLRKTGGEDGDLVLCIGGARKTALNAMGQVRLALGRERLGRDDRRFSFAWVHRFPIFEWDEEEEAWTPAHHMFTMPREEDFEYLDSDPGKVHGQLYDLVCNGVELGSGSVRIHRRDIQERVMKVIGMGRKEVEAKFGFMLKAFEYGAPPHGGIALGLDRIIMLLVGGSSIREVIAFPKTANATCPMDGSPSDVDPRLLRELHIRLEE